VDNLEHQAILSTIYSGNLRLGEATGLRVSDIDGKRMTFLVQQGKGNKDRYTLLGQRTLELLHFCYKAYSPVEWLFPSKEPVQGLSGSSVQRVLCGLISFVDCFKAFSRMLGSLELTTDPMTDVQRLLSGELCIREDSHENR
jgi:site-specific recombinase XerD